MAKDCCKLLQFRLTVLPFSTGVLVFEVFGALQQGSGAPGDEKASRGRLLGWSLGAVMQ